MKPSLSIHRAVHLAAAPGDSLYVLPGYAARAGGILLEEIRAESVHFSPTAGRHYFTRQMIRRRSEDNGRSWRVREEWTAPPGGMREPGEHREEQERGEQGQERHAREREDAAGERPGAGRTRRDVGAHGRPPGRRRAMRPATSRTPDARR